MIYLNETEIKLGCPQNFSEIIIFELLAVKLKNIPNPTKDRDFGNSVRAVGYHL